MLEEDMRYIALVSFQGCLDAFDVSANLLYA